MTDEPMPSELQGTKGWLAFLIFTLGILSPIRTIAQTGQNIELVQTVSSALGPNTETYITISWIITVATIVACLYLACILTMIHRWSTVRIAIIGFWSVALLPTGLDLVAAAILFPSLAGSAFPDVLIDVSKSSIWATIWTAYLLRSKRVANTYIRNPSETVRIFG